MDQVSELITTLKNYGVRLCYGKNHLPVSYSKRKGVIEGAIPKDLMELSKNITLKEWRDHQIVYHYDLIGAYKSNCNDHAEVVMERLGFKIISASAESIGDCWFFEVSSFVTPIMKKDYYQAE